MKRGPKPLPIELRRTARLLVYLRPATRADLGELASRAQLSLSQWLERCVERAAAVKKKTTSKKKSLT